MAACDALFPPHLPCALDTVASQGAARITVIPSQGLPYNVACGSSGSPTSFEEELREALLCTTANAPLYTAQIRTGPTKGHQLVWSSHSHSEYNELASKICCTSIFGEAVSVAISLLEPVQSISELHAANGSLLSSSTTKMAKEAAATTKSTLQTAVYEAHDTVHCQNTLCVLLCFPDEVLENIFRHLVDCHLSIFAVTRVCKDWRRVVCSSARLLHLLIFPTLAAKDLPNDSPNTLSLQEPAAPPVYPCVLGTLGTCQHPPCKKHAALSSVPVDNWPFGRTWVAWQAAKMGSVSAICYLAAALELESTSIYLSVPDSKRLRLQALYWWQKAADAGCQRAQLAVGIRLYAGEGDGFQFQESDLVGVKWGQLRPDTHARKMLKAAALAGVGRNDEVRSSALLRLGVMSLDGQGMRDGIPDLEEAHRHLKAAVKLGNAEAKVLLEDMERYQFFANGAP